MGRYNNELRSLTSAEERERAYAGLTHAQYQVYKDPARFRLLVAGRRFGKCLRSGTKVWMADGTQKPVEDLKPGDWLISVDEATLRLVPQRVKAWAENGVKPCLTLRTKRGSVTATPNHPFMVDRGAGWEWLPLEKVRAGFRIAVDALGAGSSPTHASVDGSVGEELILSVEFAGDFPTYDIEVENTHNFIAEGFVTHNTVLALQEIARAVQVRPNAFVLYVAPSLKQAKSLLWLELQRAIPPERIAYKNKVDLEIHLKDSGSIIKLGGADNADGLRGKGYTFVIMDEVADISEETWTQILRPALADKKGEALLLGTPKRLNWVFDLFMRAQEPDKMLDWSVHQYTTIQGGNVAPEEVEASKASMTAEEFKQEFEAQFTTLGNRVYTNFSRPRNIREEAQDLEGPILVGMDFNVNPMCAVLANERADGTLLVFDEIKLWNSGTQHMCQEIKTRYPGREVIVYPDPAGRQRKTSAGGRTDFTLLLQAGFRFQAPLRSPLINDRINTLQARFLAADGSVKLLINPKCQHLIKSMDGLIYSEDGKPDKKDGLDHMADALGYLVCFKYPMRRTGGGTKRLVA